MEGPRRRVAPNLLPPPPSLQAAAAATRLGYQPDPSFLLKVAQLRELFTVRWSVFLLGPAGAGKTAVWRTLAEAQTALGEATSVVVINPKAVSRDELYGCVHTTSREWRDGIVSRAFRDMASDATKAHQWIVLDGDIDPEWIEVGSERRRERGGSARRPSSSHHPPPSLPSLLSP